MSRCSQSPPTGWSTAVRVPPSSQLTSAALVAPQLDAQMRVGQPLDEPGTPLDGDDGRRQVGVQVEVVHLEPPGQPVRVHVHQRQPSTLMHAGDDERRRRHPPRRPEPRREALHEDRLARAERPVEHDQVAGRTTPAMRAPSARVSSGVASVIMCDSHAIARARAKSSRSACIGAPFGP